MRAPPPTTNKDWFRDDAPPTTRNRDADPRSNGGAATQSDDRDRRRDDDRDYRRRDDDRDSYRRGDDRDYRRDDDRDSSRRDDRDSRRDDDRGRYGGGNDRQIFAPFSNTSSSGYNDYPSHDINDWVFANARAATARAMFRRAENDVAAAYRRAQRNFERSKNYHEAVESERNAYDSYTLARQKAMRSLADDSKYKTLLKLRDDIADQLAYRRAQRDISKDEILSMATLKMNYASDARAMEISAVSGDHAVSEARDRMIAASQKSSQMRADFDDSLRDNRDIISAHQNLEDARIALITAQAYLSGSSAASAAALDYAYYSHRADVGRDPYGLYGSGYGSPYWAR